MEEKERQEIVRKVQPYCDDDIAVDADAEVVLSDGNGFWVQAWLFFRKEDLEDK
jgi:hypothetical protein